MFSNNNSLFVANNCIPNRSLHNIIGQWCCISSCCMCDTLEYDLKPSCNTVGRNKAEFLRSFIHNSCESVHAHRMIPGLMCDVDPCTCARVGRVAARSWKLCAEEPTYLHVHVILTYPVWRG